MKFDIERIIGNVTEEQKKQVEAKVQFYEKEAVYAWKQKKIDKVVQTSDLLALVLLIVCWFFKSDCWQVTCICIACALLLFGIVNTYLQNKYIKAYVHQRIKDEFANK
mgnify:CR=1 FL=1